MCIISIWFYITHVIGQCDQYIITPLSLLMISCWLGNTLEKKTDVRAAMLGSYLTCHLPLARLLARV